MNNNNSNGKLPSSPLLSKAAGGRQHRRLVHTHPNNQNHERKNSPSTRFFFEDDDIHHIPNTQMATLRNDLRRGMERERYWHVTWYDLLRGKIWLNECEKRPPIVVPRLPPHVEYVSLTNIDGTSDPWPNGAGGGGSSSESSSSSFAAGSVWKMYNAIITWILQLKSQRSSSSLSYQEEQFDKDIDAMYRDTWWTFHASIFIGLFTPLLSVLLGFITDELNPTTSFGTTPMEQKLYVLSFGGMTTALYVSIVRARFYWNVKIPGYCVEHHLRWVLMRRLLEADDDAPSSSSVDPGAATALLGPVTVRAVRNTIESFFEVVIIAANTASLFVSSLCLVLWPANRRCLSITIALMVVIMIFSILTSAAIFICYVSPLTKLERLTLRWQTRYYSLGDQQLANARNDDDDDDRATSARHSRKDRLLDDYWIAARLYRYRDFQSSIMGLSVDYFVKTTVQLFQLALIVVLAFDVVGGQLTVGRFVAVSSMSASSAEYIGRLMDVLVDVPGGYCALKQIAEVMNGKDKMDV